MALGIPIDPIIKSKIIAKVRDEGFSVSEVAREFNINSKTIYRWLKEGVINSSTSLILENNKLRKENEQLYNLLGRATAEMQRSKR